MNDLIVVDKGTILTLINSIRQFCDVTEIKGFESINIIMGIEIGLENILKSAATVSTPKEAADISKEEQKETK